MLGAAFNLTLLVLSIYFFGQDRFGLAVVCLLALVVRLLFPVINGFGILKRRVDDELVASQCNLVIEISIFVERCLQHPELQRLFDFYRTSSEPPLTATTLDGWRGQLTEIYKRKYERKAPCETVRFNVKGHIMFKDDEPWFADFIGHSIEIPVVDATDDEAPETIELRVILVNGVLTLQLGRFPKAASPKIYRDGSLAKYKTFVTITSFPLMYFHYRQGLPVKRLNLKADATESYVAGMNDNAAKSIKKQQYQDWQALHRDLVYYRALVRPEEEDEVGEVDFRGTWDKARKELNAKRDALIKKNGFKDLYNRDESDYFALDFGESFENDYMEVSFRNLNMWRDKAQDHWFLDYYEETP
jgi:hypothetical protein